MTRDLPAGTVTFLFTDIEGSTRLLHELGDSYADVLSGHRRILRRAFDDHGGHEVDTQGDSFFVAFDDPARAVAAAAASQAALDSERWPGGVTVRVRMGVHTGDPLLADGHYVGIDVHRAARIAAAAHGGQVLVSERTSRLLSENGSPALRSLGDHRLKDLPEPERLFQLLVDGLPSSFPPPRAHEDALAAAGLPDYSLPPADVPCPYKGLAAFQPEDSDLFFGREPLVADLVARLDAAPFLAVVGPSGSGKSSLVRAGLVPALQQRAGTELRTVILSPGASPVAEFDSAREARLVIVDQFEELFTLCGEEEQRTAFVDALLDRAAHGVRVVIVLRADFYGHCAGLPRLAAQLEQRQALVGPMTEEELRRAIEQPAHGAGLLLEPGVVEGILRDVVGEPGALPLLSHSLLETWRRRSGAMLTLLGYLQSGGVRGAIAQTAETVYHDALSRDQQVLARNIFLRLTELGEGTEDTRRRVSVSELTPRAGQEADVAEVLQRLSDARLVTIGDRTVEVAHEALIRHWPTLRSWLDEDREGRIAHRRLTEAAQEWEALGRDPGALLRGARLATTGDWATAHDAELNDLERDYLTASRQAAQREAERQRRANRRLRALLAGALVLLAAAVLAGVLALLQQRRAEDAADAANAQRLGALALVEKRPDTAVLLALEATRLGASPETKGALFDTLMKYGHVLRVARTDERVLRMAAPTAGGPVAVSDNSGNLMLYDPRTLALRRRITLPFSLDLAYAPDGRAIYAAGLVGDDPRDQAIRAVDPGSGDVLWTRRVPLGERGLSVTRDGRHVAWSADRVFVLLDSRTGSEVARLAIAPGSKTVPLPDGRALVLRGRSATVVDMESKHAARRLHLPAGNVTALAVTTDGSRVAIGHEDGTVAVVRLDTGRIVPMREPHEGFVESVAFSPDGTRLATAGDNDGRVLVWNPRTGERMDVLTGHGAGLRAIAFADAGRTLVSSGLDSTLIAWDVANDRAMLRSFDMPGPPCREGCFFPLFSVSGDGSKLAILGADSRVRFVDSGRLRPAGALTPHALACCQEPAFSADGRTLATAWIEPMAISLWNTRTGRLTRRLFSSDEPWPDRREHPPPLDTVAYAPDGSSLATNENDAVLLLDPATGARQARLHAPEFVEWLAYSPDSRLLEAATDNGGVTVWDLTSKKRLWSRRIDNQNTLGGAFSPDGDLLLVGGESGRIHLLEARTGEPVRAPLLAHSAYLGSLTFARDGSFFASSGMDGRTILWDTASGRALGSPFDAGAPTWTHFSPDGRTLYVVSYERGYAFDASLDTWGERACSVAGRPLTPAEWTRFMGGRRYDPACADTQ